MEGSGINIIHVVIVGGLILAGIVIYLAYKSNKEKKPEPTQAHVVPAHGQQRVMVQGQPSPY